MLNELVFLRCHSQFASYPYTSHRIRIVVKFYNHTLRLRYGCIPMQYFSLSVLLKWKHSSKINVPQQTVVLYKQLSVRTDQTDTCESAFRALDQWSWGLGFEPACWLIFILFSLLKNSKSGWWAESPVTNLPGAATSEMRSGNPVLFRFSAVIIGGRRLLQNLMKNLNQSTFYIQLFCSKNSSLPYISMHYKVPRVFTVHKHAGNTGKALPYISIHYKVPRVFTEHKHALQGTTGLYRT